MGLRDDDHVVDEVAELGILGVCNRDNWAAASFEFLDVRYVLFEHAVVRADDDAWEAFVNQREWAVLHFAGGVSLCVDVADFFQLECTFKRDWCLERAAEEEGVTHPLILFGERFDLITVSEDGFYVPGDLREVCAEGLCLLICHPAIAAEEDREHGKGGDLGDEGLG